MTPERKLETLRRRLSENARANEGVDPHADTIVSRIRKHPFFAWPFALGTVLLAVLTLALSLHNAAARVSDALGLAVNSSAVIAFDARLREDILELLASMELFLLAAKDGGEEANQQTHREILVSINSLYDRRVLLPTGSKSGLINSLPDIEDSWKKIGRQIASGETVAPGTFDELRNDLQHKLQSAVRLNIEEHE